MPEEHGFLRVIAGLGAFGVALQNYPAVELFIKSVVKPVSTLSIGASQVAAFGAGGLCGGMVNFWMNEVLLDDFFTRMMSGNSYVDKNKSLWEQIQYFGGIAVFVVTGVLFGLMAFTFAMEGPLAVLSVAAGIFVAGIMTIQEVETWLSSYDPKGPAVAETLTGLQQFGKWCGHIIAAGNVLALSLLFTLGLAQGLIAINIAAFPALIAGLAVAFTFGAFTEYYFYNFYLADFCKDFGKKCEQMMISPNAWFGLLCVSTNAFVNAALTYAGVELLAVLLVAASVALPPVAAIIALATISAIFAGSASFLLGMAFWIRQHAVKPQVVPANDGVSIAVSRYSMFALNAASNQESVNGTGLPFQQTALDPR